MAFLSPAAAGASRDLYLFSALPGADLRHVTPGEPPPYPGLRLNSCCHLLLMSRPRHSTPLRQSVLSVPLINEAALTQHNCRRYLIPRPQNKLPLQTRRR